MGNGKLEFSFGNLKFSAEGEEAWLAQQLDKCLSEIGRLPDSNGASDGDSGNGKKAHAAGATTSQSFDVTLAAHIKAKQGEDNQVRRFLATADWLRRRGTDHLTTASVSKALKDNHQKKLSNPADCLSQNVAKGHCEKTAGKEFFITPDGLRELGYTG